MSLFTGHDEEPQPDGRGRRAALVVAALALVAGVALYSARRGGEPAGPPPEPPATEPRTTTDQ